MVHCCCCSFKKIRFSLLIVALRATGVVQGQPSLRDGKARDLKPTAEASIAVGRNCVKDSYIVRLKRNNNSDDSKVKAQGLVQALGGQVEHVYDVVIHGFAAVLPAQAVEALQKNPNVEFMERNYIVSTTFRDTNTASWGLDRVDQCDLPGDSTLDTGSLGTTFDDEKDAGYAYIVDTGINAAHVEFNSRVDPTCSRNWVDSNSNPDSNWNDGHGHGTHVAGTMCGRTYGVARNCRQICAIRVLDNRGSGTDADVMAGLEYVTRTAPPRSVVNLSLGGDYSAALNAAVNNAVALGLVVVVAAGNAHADACNYSPASATAAITVGATTSVDFRSTYSNFGSCVDIFAPGSGIRSAWIGSTTASVTLSGTSMASPHVAGLALLYWEQNPNMTPAEIRNLLLSHSMKNVVQLASSTHAHLAVVPTLQCGTYGGVTCVDQISDWFDQDNYTCNDYYYFHWCNAHGNDPSPFGRTASEVCCACTGGGTLMTPPVGPPVATPVSTPFSVSTPVSPPVPPPMDTPVSGPVSPPVSTPVAIPVSPPVSDPIAPPMTPPIPPPIATPASAPAPPPVPPPVTDPVAVPVAPPVLPPILPPVSAPVSDPVASPITSPVSPPTAPPVLPPGTPPVSPFSPPNSSPVSPLISLPVATPVSPSAVPPVTPPVTAPMEFTAGPGTCGDWFFLLQPVCWFIVLFTNLIRSIGIV